MNHVASLGFSWACIKCHLSQCSLGGFGVSCSFSRLPVKSHKKSQLQKVLLTCGSHSQQACRGTCLFYWPTPNTQQGRKRAQMKDFLRLPSIALRISRGTYAREHWSFTKVLFRADKSLICVCAATTHTQCRLSCLPFRCWQSSEVNRIYRENDYSYVLVLRFQQETVDSQCVRALHECVSICGIPWVKVKVRVCDGL